MQIITIDAGNVTACGFESSLKWQLNKTLNVFGNCTFIDASFDDEDADANE